ncbi:MAG: hypothetical protein KAI40_11990 [Desulfobacterales bacterium]|nr:hypothetical protein [Desulfobacterales bacterium]
MSNPVPDENFYLIYDHLYSFEAQAWLEKKEKIDVPEFFKRKRLEDELKNYKTHLEKLVQKRTDKLTKTIQQLEEANTALKVVLNQNKAGT